MDRMLDLVLCYLQMIDIISKNDILPSRLDTFDLELLFTHIDEHPNTDASRQIEKILDLISALAGAASKLEKGQAQVGLLKALRGYRWTSYVSNTAQGFREIRVPADKGSLSKGDLWEYEAVRNLLDCVPYLGSPSRIRRCATCRRWFFAAKRADQKFCKRGNCRQQNYESSPTIRESKKLYMRRYRAEEKEREESSKRTVKFSGRTKRTP